MNTNKSAIPAGSFIMLLLFVAVLSSAIHVIYTAHKNRQLLNELYGALLTKNQIQAHWGRLTLEQSAWTAYSRVDTIASQQLGMKVPAPNEIRLIGQ